MEISQNIEKLDNNIEKDTLIDKQIGVPQKKDFKLSNNKSFTESATQNQESMYSSTHNFNI